MKIITQLNLFENQELGELEKIYAVLAGLPETDFLNRLEDKRKHGRRDYSVQSLFIALIAKIVLQLQTDKQLIRQLNMNSQLREICGFESHMTKLKDGSLKWVHAPSKSAFSRFIGQLEDEVGNLEEWVQASISEVYQLLPNFGEELALDGKIIETYATPYGDKKREDRRGEADADFLKKEKVSKSGKVITETFYGFRCHLLVDARYELPISWEVTPASHGEPTVAKRLIRQFSREKMNRAKYLMADRGYSGEPLQNLLEKKGIIPIIDNPHRWKEDKTRQYLDTDLIYDQSGNVWYVDDRGKQIKLLYKGYDKSKDSLRFGFHPSQKNPKIYRLKRSVEPIIFNRVARSSAKFKQLYKKRSSVERVNGRLDRDFRLEVHTIRGLKKMKLVLALDFLMMLGFALYKLKQNQTQHLASWVA